MNLYSPMKVQGKELTASKGFVYVSAGKRHSMAIDAVGYVYTCGDNQFRQLGFQNSDRVTEFQRVQDFPYKGKQVAAGISHSLILTDDDKLYGCGNNEEGNLGLGHTYSSDSFLQVHGMSGHKIKKIAAGRHSAVITQEGRLYVWGPVFKGDKALLLPQELRSNKLMTHVSIGDKVSAVIDEDQHVYTWGTTNSLGQLGRRVSESSDEGQKMP